MKKYINKQNAIFAIAIILNLLESIMKYDGYKVAFSNLINLRLFTEYFFKNISVGLFLILSALLIIKVTSSKLNRYKIFVYSFFFLTTYNFFTFEKLAKVNVMFDKEVLKTEKNISIEFPGSEIESKDFTEKKPTVSQYQFKSENAYYNAIISRTTNAHYSEAQRLKHFYPYFRKTMTNNGQTILKENVEFKNGIVICTLETDLNGVLSYYKVINKDGIFIILNSNKNLENNFFNVRM
ncbi:hypothetical protein [Leptospira kanakyensis]|uniref:hypothetical protein n=1 Tax=Leptospira kanakyensis TaxID=2484968 RepID=UPI00223D1F76|nr:hypothetical protein [Leptospira kanakyensis]MCW7469029.1 hypothetical protein [Leptospira kanakyensis]MCW7480016.1 hypothetical protein [Leptospira kanakyensis]